MAKGRWLQVRLTDEQHEELQQLAGNESMSSYVLSCVFSRHDPVAARQRYVPAPVADETAAAHAKWSRPIQVVPIDPAVEAQKQAKLEGLRKAQELLIAKQKKPEVKRGASSSGYAPRKRGVEYNPLGEYDEPVIDVNT